MLIMPFTPSPQITLPFFFGMTWDNMLVEEF